MDAEHERDVVILGGRVFTSEDTSVWQEALAIRGDRIAAVGSGEELVARFPDARRVDVEGRTVLPGLIDAHNHFLATGESLNSVDVRSPGVGSVDDVVERLRTAAAHTDPGEW